MSTLEIIVPPRHAIGYFYNSAPIGTGNYGRLLILEEGIVIGATTISPTYPQMYGVGNNSPAQAVWRHEIYNHNVPRNTDWQLDFSVIGGGPDWTIDSVYDSYGIHCEITIGLVLRPFQHIASALTDMLRRMTPLEPD